MNQGDLGAGGTVTQLPEPHVHQTTGLKSNSNACTYPVSKSASRGSSSNSYPTPPLRPRYFFLPLASFSLAYIASSLV